MTEEKHDPTLEPSAPAAHGAEEVVIWEDAKRGLRVMLRPKEGWVQAERMVRVGDDYTAPGLEPGDWDAACGDVEVDILELALARLVRERDEAREKAKPDGVIQFVAPAYLAELRADLATARLTVAQQQSQVMNAELRATTVEKDLATARERIETSRKANEQIEQERVDLLNAVGRQAKRLDSARAILEEAHDWVHYSLRMAIDSWLASGEKP